MSERDIVIYNAPGLKDMEVDQESNMRKVHISSSDRPVAEVWTERNIVQQAVGQLSALCGSGLLSGWRGHLRAEVRFGKIVQEPLAQLMRLSMLRSTDVHRHAGGAS